MLNFEDTTLIQHTSLRLPEYCSYWFCISLLFCSCASAGWQQHCASSASFARQKVCCQTLDDPLSWQRGEASKSTLALVVVVVVPWRLLLLVSSWWWWWRQWRTWYVCSHWFEFHILAPRHLRPQQSLFWQAGVDRRHVRMSVWLIIQLLVLPSHKTKNPLNIEVLRWHVSSLAPVLASMTIICF